MQGRAAVLAKIEKPAAIDALDEILDLCDGVMIARGDLAFIPLSDSRLAPRRLHLFSRPKAEMSEAASALSASLAQAVERLDPG